MEKVVLVNKDNCIEYSLAALKNVGRKFVQDLCEERENGEFKSMMDLASRVDLRKGGKRALESMAKIVVDLIARIVCKQYNNNLKN